MGERGIHYALEMYRNFLDSNELKAIEDILRRRKDIGPEITNPLIPDDANSKLLMGYSPRGKNAVPAFQDARKNLINFINKYKETPQQIAQNTPAVKPTVSTPTVQTVTKAFTENPELSKKLPPDDLEILKNYSNEKKPQTPSTQVKTETVVKPTNTKSSAQNFLQDKVSEIKDKVKTVTAKDPVKQQIKADAKTGAKAMKRVGDQVPKAAKPVKIKPTIRGIAGRSVPVVATTVGTVSDVMEGHNPLIATGRNIAGAVTGAMTSAGAALLATEPTVEGGMLTNMAAYAQGNEMGRNAFDNILQRFGVDTNPVKSEKPQEASNLTELSDGSIRTGGGDVYSADGQRYTTSGGVTYDLPTGQAVNPATNTISEGGYSINPATGKRTDTEVRRNGKGIIQKGRNFDTMAEHIFGSMATRAQNAGVSEAILGDINRMNPAAKFSSVHLHSTDTNPFTNLEGSFDSFANPDIAYTTGAIQPRKTEVNFSDPMQTQFKYRDDIPSVVTEPGPKKPVEYTNYMASGDPALSSIDALRMNEKQKGLIYASGQYYAEGADGKAVKVDRDLAKKVKRGAEGADALLANFLGRGGLAAAASSPVEAKTNYTVNDYDSQGNLLNERNLLTFKDGSTRYLSDIPEDEDLSATY